MKVIYSPIYDSKVARSGLILPGRVSCRLQFAAASTVHTNMSFHLSLQGSYERFPLVPAEGSMAQQSAPVSLLKAKQHQ